MKAPIEVLASHAYNRTFMNCDCKYSTFLIDRHTHAKHVIEELNNEGYDIVRRNVVDRNIVEKLDAVWLGQIKFVLSMYKNNPDKELKQSLDGLAAELFVVMAETLGID